MGVLNDKYAQIFSSRVRTKAGTPPIAPDFSRKETHGVEPELPPRTTIAVLNHGLAPTWSVRP
jgi:hypothetical protein